MAQLCTNATVQFQAKEATGERYPHKLKTEIRRHQKRIQRLYTSKTLENLRWSQMKLHPHPLITAPQYISDITRQTWVVLRSHQTQVTEP